MFIPLTLLHTVFPVCDIQCFPGIIAFPQTQPHQLLQSLILHSVCQQPSENVPELDFQMFHVSYKNGPSVNLGACSIMIWACSATSGPR